MSIWQPQLQDRSTTRVAVDVTFLRLDPNAVGAPVPPDDGVPTSFPPGCDLVRVLAPTVEFYRYLYNTVGNAYCWWLRRMTPDIELAALLANPKISLHVLYRGGEPIGFFELDGRDSLDVNLSYFGLMPHAIGTGAGYPLLLAAVHTARAGSSGGVVRVNTCTADHPRALGTYLRAGFVPMRTVREIWDIPNRLGLPIADRLRA
ncbi:GNAT family N-acetyltransferase [Lichenicola cladoniae]|uniref:GNAT family N-acetyltransferase n=1 Tax=Lichenicola cladoniae TaxID=1484109 RepID=A0A6M8HMS0_9PROT|nr:GNAT family N-acetyltransferase [Lichenicola cladoniae]NPD67065.1 GNAT family N-acetyltransferase [Acetobacteraceae bacterium]QKE89606.1 GNAT family N-acetyltransferase [Lichenicola cladoniae]